MEEKEGLQQKFCILRRGRVSVRGYLSQHKKMSSKSGKQSLRRAHYHREGGKAIEREKENYLHSGKIQPYEGQKKRLRGKGVRSFTLGEKERLRKEREISGDNSKRKGKGGSRRGSLHITNFSISDQKKNKKKKLQMG